MSPAFFTNLLSEVLLLYTVILVPFNLIVEPFIPEFLDVNILYQVPAVLAYPLSLDTLTSPYALNARRDLRKSSPLS